jgi:FlaA1/EpsC-like NDP-sugar epimerase
MEEGSIISHVAAFKHVVLCERTPQAAIQTNILGTQNVIQAARAAGVERVLFTSSDKAVNPTNVMGASKRLAELILQGLAESGVGRPVLSMVRFGNVLDSSGSVVPLFRSQIREGGPVTVTHPDVIRYFMTIPEASQLVLQASALAEGGDVFVLEMGKPVPILELARRMIHLSGLQVRDENNPDGDIEIIFTGLRPGEKLYGELLIGNNVSPTVHPMIQRARECHLDWAMLEKRLEVMEALCARADEAGIRRQLGELVDGYDGKPVETEHQAEPEWA